MANDDKKLTFIEHLEELRLRIIISLITVVITTIFGYFFADSAITFLKKPIDSISIKPSPSENILRIIVDKDKSLRLFDDWEKVKQNKNNFKGIEFIFPDNETLRFPQGNTKDLYAFKLTDKFMLKFKAAFILGIIFAIPILLWQSWLFVSPGLTMKEKKAIKPVLLIALLLFPIGVLFAYYIMSFTIDFLLNFAFQDITVLVNVNDYIAFTLNMMLSFGIVFELPIIVVVLSRIGIINSKMMRHYRKYAIVLLLIASAIFTPGPDIFSMLVMAVPLLLLYEFSVYLAKIFEKKEEVNYER